MRAGCPIRVPVAFTGTARMLPYSMVVALGFFFYNFLVNMDGINKSEIFCFLGNFGDLSDSGIQMRYFAVILRVMSHVHFGQSEIHLHTDLKKLFLASRSWPPCAQFQEIVFSIRFVSCW